MNYISLGGWCGPKIALKQNDLFDEPSLPFDDVRCKFEGVVRNIEENFENFLTYNKQINDTFFIGKDLSFVHHNIKDKNVIESFKRKIYRFHNKIISQENICFLRFIVENNYDIELKLYEKFKKVIKEKYNKDNFYFVFIISGIEETKLWKCLDKNCYIFCIKDVMFENVDISGVKNIGKIYEPIFNFMGKILLDKPKKTNLSIFYDGHIIFNDDSKKSFSGLFN